MRERGDGSRSARRDSHHDRVRLCPRACVCLPLPPLYAQFVGKLVKEFPAAAQMDVGNGPYIIAFILLIGTALVSYFGLSESRRPAAFWAAGASLAMVVLIITQFTLPLLSHYYVDPPQRLAEVAGLNLGREDRLIVYGQPRPSLVLYATESDHGSCERRREHRTIFESLGSNDAAAAASHERQVAARNDGLSGRPSAIWIYSPLKSVYH